MTRPIRTVAALLTTMLLMQPLSAQPRAEGLGPLATASMESAEFVMLDARGSRIVGHGHVEDGVLRFTVGQSVGDFVLLVVLGDGEVVRLVGREWNGDSFRLSLDSGGQLELQELADELGLRLRLERLEPGVTTENPSSGPPGSDDDDDAGADDDLDDDEEDTAEDVPAGDDDEDGDDDDADDDDADDADDVDGADDPDDDDVDDDDDAHDLDDDDE